MGDLVVTRWRRYGKDRLYVAGADGTRIGWIDMVTGATTLEAPGRDGDLARAALAHGAPQVPAGPGPATVPSGFPAQAAGSADMLPAPWTDLALNVPGQAARAQAEVELTAAREHSRVGSFLARAFDVKTDERAWRVGADGEETVGARLEKLRKHGWHVLHAVPVGDRGADIDHLIIGPGGVWTINTKTHKGKSVWVGGDRVRVGGHRQPYAEVTVRG
jgi:hypothetical protein